MVFLLDIVFGILAGFLTLWIAGELRAPRPVAVVLAVLVGFVVFLAGLGARVV